ncbi:MAG TPA: PEP-CTERM sorting domain-containing protein, partial [Pirellulales bacterium]
DMKDKNATELTGSITLNDEIIGLIVLSNSLNASTSVLGLPGVIYPSGPDHGLDVSPNGGPTSDTVTLSADRRTVTVDFQDAGFPDELRIVTAVPEPSSMILMLSAIGFSAVGMFSTANPRRRYQRSTPTSCSCFRSITKG